ncbi:MAG: hypothetical protein AAB478_04510 [Patescibacteria group bacterium]|mgnify:CR=1 FL=1
MDQNPPSPYSTEIPVPPPPQPVVPSPVMPPAPSRNHHKLLNFVMLAVIIILGAWIAILTLRQTSQPAPNQVIPTPTILPTATPTPTPEASMSADPTSNRFYSQELGIMFDYAKEFELNPNQLKKVTAQQVNNRVYLVPEKMPPSQEPYVDVFTKISTDAPVDAVKKITQSDLLYKNCTFQVDQTATYPSIYTALIPLCPGAPRREIFLMDSQHPTVLLVLNLGSYDLPASSTQKEIGWEDTVRFL